ncbi:MAG: DUF3106 domain-containing protein [Pseudomonadota bacterium]
MTFLVLAWIATGAIAIAATGTSVDQKILSPAVVTANGTTSVAATTPAIPANSPAAKAAEQPTKPLWANLTPPQQQALFPLAAEWDRLDPVHKTKWLAISSKFSTMKNDQQVRLQNRMRDWAKLTPEQRRVARESYSRAKKLNPGQRTAEWQQYQQLPEEQKRKLAAEAAAKKRIANLPSASQGKNKVTPPPKSALKSQSEQSLMPSAGNQSALQPSTQPAIK